MQQSFLRRFVWILGLLLMLVLGLFTLLMVGAETGATALATGIIIAVIPVPVYILLLLWIDRFEREPGALLALCFLWGASVAAFIAYAVNTYVTLRATSLFGVDDGLLMTAILASPLSEEFAKGLALLIICFWQRDEFDGVIDGIVYAGMVGLGFAMFENFLYYGKAAMSGKIADVIILRGFLSPFSHPLFTSMTGIGFGLALTTPRMALRVVYPLIGFILAVTIHFLWNLSAANGNLPQTYDHLMVPIFVSILLIIGLELHREGQILRLHLEPELASGFFDPQQYERLCSVRGRLSESWHAMRKGGLRAWCDQARLHHLVSELAFYRHRVQRGSSTLAVPNADFERAHLTTVQSLRDKLADR